MILLALGVATMPFTKTLADFAVACTAASLGMGVQPLLLTSATLSARELGRGISAFSAALSLSLALGPIYLSVLSGLLGVSLLYSLVGLIPPLFIGLYAYTASAKNLKAQLKFEPSRLLELLRDRKYLEAVAVEAAYTVSFAAFTTYGAILAAARGASLVSAEASLSIFFASSLAARTLLAAANPKTTPTLVFAPTIAGLLLAAFSEQMAEVVASFILLGLAHGIAYPLSSIYAAEAVSQEELALANTALSGISAAIQSVFLPVLGYVAQKAGLMCVFLTPIPITAVLGMALAARRPRKASDTKANPSPPPPTYYG